MDILALLRFPHLAASEVTMSRTSPHKGTLISYSIEVAVDLYIFHYTIAYNQPEI